MEGLIPKRKFARPMGSSASWRLRLLEEDSACRCVSLCYCAYFGEGMEGLREAHSRKDLALEGYMDRWQRLGFWARGFMTAGDGCSLGRQVGWIGGCCWSGCSEVDRMTG